MVPPNVNRWQNSAFLAEILDLVPAYVYIKDKDHRYQYGNRMVQALFGCTGEELAGQQDSAV